jgi:hypothetical protein
VLTIVVIECAVLQTKNVVRMRVFVFVFVFVCMCVCVPEMVKLDRSYKPTFVSLN